MSVDRPCAICEATAKGLVGALQVLDNERNDPTIARVAVVLNTALVQPQIYEMVVGLQETAASCPGNCDVRNLLTYLLTGKGPKLPDDEQPQFDLR